MSPNDQQTMTAPQPPTDSLFVVKSDRVVKAVAPRPMPASLVAWVVRELEDIEHVICLVRINDADTEQDFFLDQFDPKTVFTRGASLTVNFRPDNQGFFWPWVVPCAAAPPADLEDRMLAIEDGYRKRQAMFGNTVNF